MKNIIRDKTKLETPFSVQFEGSFGSVDSLPNAKVPEVCILGRSNSGKSTLLSGLIRESRQVKISSKPGSTRTINLYRSGNFTLADLPGYGYAKTSHASRDVLSNMINEYLRKRQNLHAGFLTHDARREITKEEIWLSEAFRAAKKPLFLLLTKADKLTQKEINVLEKVYSGIMPIFQGVYLISAKSREGLNPIYHFLRTFS